ncbi:MAG: elongation factor P-like protein YeiP [Gammaproteobacteria bacterium]|nr:elongation factor P-like protein YeiP [Gammaproteobacteria bacterium]MCP5135698.1 elongation factor P-like protein YeiP [Gammaproteobacteria bacterium]
MPKANEIKRGAAVEVDGESFLVRDIEVKSPSARGASTLYKFRLVNARTQQNIDRQFKGDDFIKEADIVRRKVQFLYRAGEEFTFMDDEDYSQFTLNEEDIGEQIGYLVDGLGGIMAMLIDGDPVAVELPASVNLEIVDTAPGIKGASASARSKPATLATGIEVQIPEYLEIGEVIRINTETGKYMSRA